MKVNICVVVRPDFDPGETAVLVLAEEGLGAGPLDDVSIDAIAPQVQPPVVVIVAGGVIAIVAVRAQVVDDGIGSACRPAPPRFY